MTVRKPQRSYCASLSPEGEKIELLVDCDRQTLEALMREDANAIEEAEVLRWGREYEMSLHAPGARALAGHLNVIRVTKPAKKFLGDNTQTAFFERLVDKIIDVQRDLSTLIDAGSSGENLIRWKDRDGRNIAVTEIDKGRLIKDRAALASLCEYLGRYVPETLHSETRVGDIAALAHLLRRAVETKDKKPGFSNPTGTGVNFITPALIRTGAIAASACDDRENIAQALHRLRRKTVAAFQRLKKTIFARRSEHIAH